MRAAIYARVSTERQGRQQTIESQLAALRAWALGLGHELAAEHVFRDEGYSGSRLDRPGLDGLRDAVRDGAVDVVAVLSPDRLARKYAYQVLLLEELRRAGCQVAFLHHPISDDPNDQLLLQIQGAVRSKAPSPSTSARCSPSGSAAASCGGRARATSWAARAPTGTGTSRAAATCRHGS
jgi:site-specific DNA recombinase